MARADQRIAVRRAILEQAKRANVGGAGTCLSLADIMLAVYESLPPTYSPEAPDRDRVIVSNGHASLGAYAALYVCGLIGFEQLNSFCEDGTLFGVEPCHLIPGFDFSSGSLGQGLPFGAGCALAARMQGSERRVFTVVSDGECNEGSVWEAVMFAAHHRLSNLIVLIDVNGQQGFGRTDDVLRLSPLAERWRAFEWNAQDVDGHDPDAMRELITRIDTRHGAPTVLVARTTFGAGVSFMEGRVDWHYRRMTDEEYTQALADVEAMK
jgi:transketolase